MAVPNLPQFRRNPGPRESARPRAQNFSCDETGVTEKHFVPPEDDARRQLIERATKLRLMKASEREELIAAKESRMGLRTSTAGSRTRATTPASLSSATLRSTAIPPGVSAPAAGALAEIPPEVLTEKQVLRFFAFSKESVPESPLEAFRVRRAVICLHVTDQTLEIFEPRDDNSGLPQGMVLKRQRVLKRGATKVPLLPEPKEEKTKKRRIRGSTAASGVVGVGPLTATRATLRKLGVGEGGTSLLVTAGGGGEWEEKDGEEDGEEEEEDGYFTWRDFRVGETVKIYGVVYRLVDADGFTREWYAEQGVGLREAEEVPEDEVSRRRREAEATLPGPKSKRGHHKKLFEDKMYIEAQRGKFVRDPARRAQWEAHDGEVLRFDCLWRDGRDDEDADVRHLLVEYFLADDEVRVLESHHENDGREPSRVLVLKAPLPKAWTERKMQLPGFDSAVSGPAVREDVLAISGYIPAAGETAGAKGPAPMRFLRPADIRVGGTIDVYGRTLQVRACDAFTREWYRREMGVEQATARYEREPVPEKPRLPIPPHAGIGDEDDTYQSCLTFKPRPPRRDFGKWAAYGTAVAKFRARLEGVEGDEALRRFTLSIFPADDTMYVFERGNPMIGPKGRKFLNRGKYRHPDGKVIQVHDIVPGKLLVLARRTFRVDDADIATRALFPHANVPVPADAEDNLFGRPAWAATSDGVLPPDAEEARKEIAAAQREKDAEEIRRARAVVRHKTYGAVSIGVTFPEEEYGDGDGVHEGPDE